MVPSRTLGRVQLVEQALGRGVVSGPKGDLRCRDERRVERLRIANGSRIPQARVGVRESPDRITSRKANRGSDLECHLLLVVRVTRDLLIGERERLVPMPVG